jgi:hypothetical protein
MKSYMALLAGLLSIAAIGCEVDVADTDGEPADVDVIETDDAPAVDEPDVNVSSETLELEAPDVDVDAEAPADAAPADAAPAAEPGPGI